MTLMAQRPTENASALPRVSTPTGLHAVLCGSFRRDWDGLARAWDELVRGFDLLSPVAVDFIDPDAAFVRLAHEIDESAESIENRHLDSITRADFVWLHCPEGYVGTSAALEIGHARAVGVPVFAACEPSDEMLAAYVTVVATPAAVPSVLAGRPGSGVAALQAYYGRVAARRGWAHESPRDTLLLLTEELGELARAVRKREGMRRDGVYPDTDVQGELADVQLYLVHLANTLGVDLGEAVTAKELVNAQRFAATSQAEVA